jgi:ammonia channel protein AmtB
MSETGILFTSLVSFLIFVSAFFAGYSIYRRRKDVSKLLLLYSYFLLITGALWFMVSLRLFFAWLGSEFLNRIFFIADQVLVFASGIPIAYYLSLKILRKEGWAKIVTFFFGLIFLLATFSLLSEGIVGEEERTFFASKFKVDNEPEDYWSSRILLQSHNSCISRSWYFR